VIINNDYSESVKATGKLYFQKSLSDEGAYTAVPKFCRRIYAENSFTDKKLLGQIATDHSSDCDGGKDSLRDLYKHLATKDFNENLKNQTMFDVIDEGDITNVETVQGLMKTEDLLPLSPTNEYNLGNSKQFGKHTVPSNFSNNLQNCNNQISISESSAIICRQIFHAPPPLPPTPKVGHSKCTRSESPAKRLRSCKSRNRSLQRYSEEVRSNRGGGRSRTLSPSITERLDYKVSRGTQTLEYRVDGSTTRRDASKLLRTIVEIVSPSLVSHKFGQMCAALPLGRRETPGGSREVQLLDDMVSRTCEGIPKTDINEETDVMQEPWREPEILDELGKVSESFHSTFLSRQLRSSQSKRPPSILPAIVENDTICQPKPESNVSDFPYNTHKTHCPNVVSILANDSPIVKEIQFNDEFEAGVNRKLDTIIVVDKTDSDSNNSPATSLLDSMHKRFYPDQYVPENRTRSADTLIHGPPVLTVGRKASDQKSATLPNSRTTTDTEVVKNNASELLTTFCNNKTLKKLGCGMNLPDKATSRVNESWSTNGKSEKPVVAGYFTNKIKKLNLKVFHHPDTSKSSSEHDSVGLRKVSRSKSCATSKTAHCHTDQASTKDPSCNNPTNTTKIENELRGVDKSGKNNRAALHLSTFKQASKSKGSSKTIGHPIKIPAGVTKTSAGASDVTQNRLVTFNDAALSPSSSGCSQISPSSFNSNTLSPESAGQTSTSGIASDMSILSSPLTFDECGAGQQQYKNTSSFKVGSMIL